MAGNFAALEAARSARGGVDPFRLSLSPPAPSPIAAFKRTDFGVGKVYDDERPFVPERTGMTRDTAEAVAGRLRDAMTEEEVRRAVEEGWNYGYKALRGNIGRPRTPFVPKAPKPRTGFQDFAPDKRKQLSLLGNRQRAKLLSPERRIEIAKKANAARGWKCACGKPATQRVPWKYGRFHRRCDECAK